jgi:SAM-dependent methyltransferase
MDKIENRTRELKAKYELPYERHRIEMIHQLVPKPSEQGSLALDLACSGGVFSNILQSKDYKVVGLDLNGEDLECAHCNNLISIMASVEQLPLRKNCFTFVFALEIIEHLSYGRTLLEESKRVIREDGDLLISTPNRISLEGLRGKIQQLITGVEYNFWDENHRYIYRSFEFARLVKEYFTLQRVWGYMPLFAVSKSVEKILQKNPLYRFFSQPVKSLLKWFCFDIIIHCKVK